MVIENWKVRVKVRRMNSAIHCSMVRYSHLRMKMDFDSRLDSRMVRYWMRGRASWKVRHWVKWSLTAIPRRSVKLTETLMDSDSDYCWD